MKKLGMPTKSTIITAIVLLITLTNGILTILGKPILEIGEAEVGATVDMASATITAISLIVVPLFAAWKNMSVTKAAIRADEALHTGAFDTEDPQNEEEYNA